MTLQLGAKSKTRHQNKMYFSKINRGTIVDLEKEKANVESTEPKQNELELDFSVNEPVTPKRPVVQKVSFLDKLKQRFNRKPTAQTETVSTEINLEEPNSNENQSSEETIVAERTTHWKKPETWAILSILPQRHRRLFVVLFAFVLLFILYFLLKPSSTTVTSLEQQNGNAVPIQFQPIDKNQEMPNASETSGLDQLVNQLQAQDKDNNVVVPAQSTNDIQPLAPVAQPEVVTQTPVTPAQPEVKQPKAEPTPVAPVPVEKKAVATKPVEKVLPKAPAKTPAKIVEQKNDKNLKTRTLTVPQGVSLMQVFRNQNLNIAEVNAMTKAKGANKALSNFKAGDKVKVSLNNKGNVVELQLQDGSKFIRQKDGSYIYKK